VTTNALLDQHDAARIAGQRHIQERWRFLLPRTRDVLQASGFYSDRGRLVPDAERNSDRPEHDVEALEQSIGVLYLCARSTLPDRSKTAAPIPGEALDRTVEGRCQNVFFVPAWRDPVFLRLSLRAVVQHELAATLCLVGPGKAKSVALGCLSAIVYAVLLLLSPVPLGSAMVSAAGGDFAGTVLSLYGVGVCAYVLWWAKVKAAGEDVPELERRYNAWSKFRYMHCSAAIGAGSQHYLTQIALKGVPVPEVAFDLCAALQAA